VIEKGKPPPLPACFGGTLGDNVRILWHSNSPWASTGYGNQTKLFTPRIRDLGHDVGISAFWGLEGGLLGFMGMPVYPRAFHPFGNDVVGAHGDHFHADIILSLTDAWVLDAKMFQPTKWVPWFPVDHDPLPAKVFSSINQAYDRIVFSKFGEKMVQDSGLSCRYVPHGVETKVFRPLDQQECRKRIGFQTDRFVVGMVAANKGNPSRKAFEPQIRAFAEFSRKHDDALLYIHSCVATGGENQGVNLVELCNVNGLTIGHNVIFSDQYTNVLGFPDNYMVDMYNSFDVFMLVSMGEGFGIPILEAQACGCPVIVGDWTSMSELCFSGWKVDKKDAVPFWTPLASYQFMPKYEAILDKLEASYEMRGNKDYRSRARDGALAYDADKITEKYWKPVLETIAGNL
jgi:glycosyltransferase involved in cell wall biosynthesis